MSEYRLVLAFVEEEDAKEEEKTCQYVTAKLKEAGKGHIELWEFKTSEALDKLSNSFSSKTRLFFKNTVKSSLVEIYVFSSVVSIPREDGNHIVSFQCQFVCEGEHFVIFSDPEYMNDLPDDLEISFVLVKEILKALGW